MSDDLQRRGLANSILARLPSANLGELRLLDAALTTIEILRAGGDRQWERHLATGPGDVDRSYHLVGWSTNPAAVTLCRGSWPSDDRCEAHPNPPIEERCSACSLAVVGGSLLGQALLDVADQLAILDRERAELQEQARAEMLGEGR